MRHLNGRFPRLSKSLFPVISDVTNSNIQMGILGTHEAFELASLKTKLVFISIQLVSICLLAPLCVAVCCSVLQCSAVCCICLLVSQCVAVCCSVLQCDAV